MLVQQRILAFALGMQMWTLVVVCVLPGVALADQATSLRQAQKEVLVSLDRLRAAIEHTLEIESRACNQGVESGCQDALLSTAALNIVDAEIALKKLSMTVRSSETNDLIDDAGNQLNETRSSLNEIQEKLDE